MELRGRHVLVTGASRGIGSAIAREVAARGGRVTVVARTEDALGDLAAEIGGTAVAADLFDAAQVNGLVARVEELAGPVDVLVNNAGMMILNSIFELSEQEVVDLLRLNLEAPIQLTRTVLPGMRERGRGHVLNISSIAAWVGPPGMSVYAASKAGLSHFTRILRQDLKRTGIALSYLEVGPVPTDLLHNTTYAPALETIARFERLGLLVEVPVEKVARRAVDAIVKDKRVVRLPRRMAGMGALSGAPQRLSEPLVPSTR